MSGWSPAEEGENRQCRKEKEGQIFTVFVVVVVLVVTTLLFFWPAPGDESSWSRLAECGAAKKIKSVKYSYFYFATEKHKSHRGSEQSKRFLCVFTSPPS